MKQSNRHVLRTLTLLLILTPGLVGCSASRPPDRPQVVVTTSWLECVLRDVAGDTFEIIRLSSPGGCPGHFDMKPSQMTAIRDSRFLFRFDFQNSLDEKVAPMCGRGLTIVPVIPGQGLCVPDTYLRSCHQIADALSCHDPDLRETCAASLARIERRLQKLTNDVRAEVKQAGLTGSVTVASSHQTEFCRWLGLDVVEAFGSQQADNARDLAELIRSADPKHVPLIVANLQEGDRQARTLARRLNARIVVFSNFPDMSPEQDSFDALLRRNVRHLLETPEP